MRAIYQKQDGSMAVIIPAPKALKNMSVEEIAAKDSPEDAIVIIVENDEIPADRTFRNAWRVDTSNAPQKVRVDIPAAKIIAHDKRRVDRAVLFAPLDILATIPAEAIEAETKRQVIRDNDAAKQLAIDIADNVDGLRLALGLDIEA